MKKGTPKLKKMYQFYQTFALSGTPPETSKPIKPKEPDRCVLDVDLLMRIPDQEHWLNQWEGEPEETWQERKKLGWLSWRRYIDGAKCSKKPAVKERNHYYIDLNGSAQNPIPIRTVEIWIPIKGEMVRFFQSIETGTTEEEMYRQTGFVGFVMDDHESEF
jgi:hypothetical protein